MSEKLTAQITFRLSGELYEAMQEVAQKERRKPTEIARALLERGYAAYQRDGQLFEPEEPEILSTTGSKTSETQQTRKKRA
jgi:hypothetical protein